MRKAKKSKELNVTVKATLNKEALYRFMLESTLVFIDKHASKRFNNLLSKHLNNLLEHGATDYIDYTVDLA